MRSRLNDAQHSHRQRRRSVTPHARAFTCGSVASSGLVLETIIPRNSGTGKILSPSEQSLFLSFTSVRGKRIGIDSVGVTGFEYECSSRLLRNCGHVHFNKKDSFDFSLSRSPITFAIIYINFVLKYSSRDLGASEKSNISP